MKQSLWNPYLPLWEYIPDGEPHVFQERLYIFGSHDEENGTEFCPGDYTAWSAPEEDLSDWRCEGVIYRKNQDPANPQGKFHLYAPDVACGNDGRYYLFYGLDLIPRISVAVCDTPAGSYTYLGTIQWPNGEPLEKYMPYDPAVINDEGRIYLYYGFAPDFPMHGGREIKCPGCCVVELEEDMLTVKGEPRVILPAKEYAGDTEFEGHAFFEAASIRKAGDTYYLVYDSQWKHQLCYAVSKYPDREFHFGGPLISNGDIGYEGRTEGESVWSPGNNHGGMVQVKGSWYIFYHRHTNGTMFSRQGCAERIEINEDGSIKQAEMTTVGLGMSPLLARGRYPAAIACNLWGRHGAKSPVFGKRLEDTPIVCGRQGKQYIEQIEDGTVIGYKYFQFQGDVTIKLAYQSTGAGVFEVRIRETGACIGQIHVTERSRWGIAQAQIYAEGSRPLFLKYLGTGQISLKAIEFC